MLEFRINLKRPDFLSLKWDGAGFSYGDSFIRPFKHPAIGCFALGDNHNKRFLFAIYERNFRGKDPVDNLQVMLLASGSEIDTVKSAMLNWPLNVVLLDITEGEVSIRSGACATCPVYAGTEDSTIFGSWDSLATYKRMPRKKLNVPEVAAFMSANLRYSSDTFIEGVTHLTERTAFHFGGNGIRLVPAENAPYIQPKIVQGDADVVAAFNDLLCASISQWLDPDYTVAGVEASGGLDSSCVALALRRAWQKDINSFSILLEENGAGQQQRKRREELIQKIGAIDHTVTGNDYLPMSGNLLCAPTEEIYLESLNAEIEIAVESGTRIIFTGIGGDELTKLSYTEHLEMAGDREERAPPHNFSILTDRIRQHEDLDMFLESTSVVPISTLLAAVARAPSFLRRGVWPAHPLASSDVYSFARSLPLEWRKDRLINRKHLEKYGMSQDFCYPKLRENFGGLFQKAIGNIGSAGRIYLNNSTLIEQGVIDREKLTKALAACDSGSKAATDAAQQVLCFVRVEKMLFDIALK